MDYRMIGAQTTASSPAGCCRIDDDMPQHGARPTWLGYIVVPDVDAVGRRDRAGRRQGADAGERHPGRRPSCDGDRPAGRALLRHEAAAARGRSQRQERRLFAKRRAARRLERTVDHGSVDGARRFYGEQFGWGSRRVHADGRNGRISLLRAAAASASARCAKPCPAASPNGASISASRRSRRRRPLPKQNGGTIHMGPHQVPTGDWIVIGTDPQGAEFALVGGQ